ncbi:MAG: dihydrolipoyl dehydrogenase [Candidatus Hydrothermales bacterium]
MKYKAIVIGAGPGGYVCAIRLGQLGIKSLVVDKKFIGGVCLNVGCVPTKALIYASHIIETNEKAKKEMGLIINESKFDLEKLRDWKEKIINRLTNGILSLWKHSGIEFIKGEAIFESEKKIKVKTESGEIKEFEGENIVIATGSDPAILKGFEPDGKYIWTSDDAVALKEIPKKLLILGGGAIGIEFAYIYKNFGSDVEVIEIMDQILPGMDKEMVQELTKILKRKGIKIYTERRAKEVSVKNGKVNLLVEYKDKEEIYEGDVLLLSVGRKPNSKIEGIDKLDIKIDERGFIKVDKKRRANEKGVFAIGDVAGPPLLAHKASKEGIVAAEVIAGLNSEFDPRAIPLVVYTIPEFASVGLTEEEAKSKGIDIAIGKFPLVANGRALTQNESMGLAKIIVNRENDEILGIHILSPEASSMICEAALAIEMGATSEDIALTIHPHPTFGEILMEAAENVYKKAIHIINK